MIEQILKNNYCAGCGLCQSIFGTSKISVEFDQLGFYRPKMNSKLDKRDESLLSKVCPGRVVKKEKNLTPIKDTVWGDMFSCFVGSAKDETIRTEASSGGGISSILTYLLETRKVSAVIHIGASEKKPYLNEIKISTNRIQVIENANSRYSPSSPLINILNDIKKYDSYAFVGKPCDIAALRQFAKYNAEINEKIKYYITFFCAGVPSANATTDIIDAMDINKDELKSLHYRKDGWPGFLKITDKNNQIHKLSYSLTWMKLLGPRVQFRCKICADGIGHLSDIVCSDAWEDYDHKGFPTFKDAPGKSLIVSRTQQGEQVVQEALRQNYLIKHKTVENLREIDKMQPGQFSKKTSFLSRRLAILIKNKNAPKFDSDFYLKATLHSKPIDFIRNFYGTLKRVK